MFSKRKEEYKNLEKLHYRFKIYDVILLHGYTVVGSNISGWDINQCASQQISMMDLYDNIILRIRMQINLFCIGCCRYVMQKMEKNGI